MQAPAQGAAKVLVESAAPVRLGGSVVWTMQHRPLASGSLAARPSAAAVRRSVSGGGRPPEGLGRAFRQIPRQAGACLLAGAVLLGACGGPPASPDTLPATKEPPPVVVTRWTELSELFLEYPPLNAGQTSRFALHLTDLGSFEPITEGRVVVELTHDDGTVERFAVDGPSRPGIFGVDVSPERPGSPALAVRVSSSALSDEHDLGPAVVRGPQASPRAHQATDEIETGAVTFLKEQQWNLDFATQLVQLGSIQSGLLAPATVEPRSGGRLVVVAPVSGRLLASAPLPALGASVSRETQLGAIVPLWSGPPDRSTLELPLAEAEVGLQSAERQLRRAERLFAAGAVPARRIEEAKAHQQIARARLDAAKKRMDSYEESRRDDPHSETQASFTVRSHLDGVVTALFATDGAHVEEGDPLLEVVAIDSVRVSAAVPESQAPALRDLRGAELELPGAPPVALRGPALVGRVVDPATRTIKVSYLADNRGLGLALGQAVSLRLLTSKATQAPLIPTAALVEDAGRTLVYVQTGGEWFEARPVELGARQGGRVQVTAGLRAGERVVTEGAYLVRLASASPQVPAHGHVH